MATELEFERRLIETMKAAGERGQPLLAWAMEAGRCAQECGLGIPCLELGEVLVASLCFDNNNPTMWKFLDQAMASQIVSPIHALALLTSRVIPHRRTQPEAYRLYLELLGRYINLLFSTDHLPPQEKIMKCIDDAMHLSCTFGIQITYIGQTLVLFVFSIIINLIESILEDCGLPFESTENKFNTVDHGFCEIDVNSREHSKNRNEHREVLRKRNVYEAIKMVEGITANKSGKIILRLVYLNMPEKFNCLLQRLEYIEVKKPTLRNLISADNELTELSRHVHDAVRGVPFFNKNQLIGSLINISPGELSNYYNLGAGQTACWITFDIFMEKAMDGRQLYPTSSVNILKELTISLQIINQASWQETFMALWISSLRLVQRERELLEGPIPHLDARLCMLLAITPLAIASIIKEEELLSSGTDNDSKNMKTNNSKCMEGSISFSRRHGLVSSLQLLGQFSGLLSPPPSVVQSANSAATKAAFFISNFKKGNDDFDGIIPNDNSVKAIGNMLHLIVEACIARNLIDTSAYFWPGYVAISSASMDSVSVQDSSWSALMEGAQLCGSLKNSLMITPASSIDQVEKLYNIALCGSEEERSAAVNILCGASLTCGWNIQEHVVHFMVKLLSPPVPQNISESGSHLFSYISMLNSILVGVGCIDVVHIISLYGKVPDVAAALMHLCETFGSVPAVPSSRASTSDETSIYSVFSRAFLFLLRLWKFYGVPQEHITAERRAHPELTLDYLLLMHNTRIASENSFDSEQSTEPVYIDSFPRLQAWYVQYQACMASTLTGLCNANPICQVANKILNMICQKMTKVGMMSGNHSSTSSGSIGGSPASMSEDGQHRLNLSAWEIMNSVPYVLEALLTACANGRLSSRELTTGLRLLVDFLPASLATILSYFSAEVTRGIWKQVPMNGTDWPSPAANLPSIESEIRETLASVGVNLSSHFTGGTVPVMLPLPMAALIGLTITFKLEKGLEYIHGVAGPALENCASCCPWPSMPVIGALWEQKARRWHDFIILSCARSPFRQNRDAICQLLRSCFECFLGSSSSSVPHASTSRGVNALLGYGFLQRGTRLPIAPGFLYIRSCWNFLDPRLVSNEIVKLITASAREMAPGWVCSGVSQLKSSQMSIASAAAGVKQIATLGSSLLCATGGLWLVQVLYMETMPTWLISRRERKATSTSTASCILEGYALAHLLILSGAFVWGTSDAIRNDVILPSRPRRARCISTHMDFLARALDGEVSLGCDPVTWKAYVSCFLGMLVCFVPSWVPHAKQTTLRKLASRLRGWHESELALSLLERGGPEAMASVVECIL